MDIEDILALPVREKIGRAKYIPEEKLSEFDALTAELKKEMLALTDEGDI